MGKLINEPITCNFPECSGDPEAIPRQFIWRGRQYQVEAVGGEWRMLGRWWEGEGERRFVRALTGRGLAMDLCQDLSTGQWMVYEVQD